MTGNMVGTLMWVGDTSVAEFQGAVEYCLTHISQLAFRRDESEAIARPASDVCWIIYAKSNRGRVDFGRLSDRYPQAKSITLLGPLCQGVRSSVAIESHDWQHWNEVLPCWFGLERPSPPRCQSVAVVASTLSSAEPLLELAESAGATAVWCRHPSGQSVRNFDAVWWDDSIADPVSRQAWQQRIDSFARFDRRVQHAWITHSTRMEDHREATTGGIDLLANKPHGIYNLLMMLEQSPAVGPTIHSRAA